MQEAIRKLLFELVGRVERQEAKEAATAQRRQAEEEKRLAKEEKRLAEEEKRLAVAQELKERRQAAAAQRRRAEEEHERLNVARRRAKSLASLQARLLPLSQQLFTMEQTLQERAPILQALEDRM